MSQQLILGRYRPLEDLGEGAFGTVVLAWDTRMQRRVAIKRLDLPLDTAGRTVRPTGLAEARTAAMLNHPNIVTVFDFDTDLDEAFIVMEHVDGASLGEILSEVTGGKLEPGEVAAIVADVAAALQFAHENGVLHLDVKPDNILVTRDGRAKVSDFGISDLSSLAGHGPAWGGTAGYMPIEQLEGDTVSEASDQWALAVIAYQALCGENPFASTRLQASLAQFTAFRAPALSRARTATPLSHEIDELFERALDPVPSARFESIADFAAEALALLGDPIDGRATLAELVAEIRAEESEEDDAVFAVGLWDRMAGSTGAAVAVRTVAAAESAWLAFAGLGPLVHTDPTRWIATALVALAGALAPGLGIGLSLLMLLAGLVGAGAWVAASFMLVIGLPWWWIVARRDTAASILPLGAPFLGVVRLSFLQPLLAGFILRPARAALTALLGATLTMLASIASGASGSGFSALSIASVPNVWDVVRSEPLAGLAPTISAGVALLGWAAAAFVASLIASRATRGAGVAASVAGGGVLALAYAAAARIDAHAGFAQGYGSATVVISLAASLILMVFLASLGAPLRAEPDEPPHEREEPTEDA